MTEEAPLGEVLRQLGEQQKQLGGMDSEISVLLRRFEMILRTKRPTGHPVDVAFPPWGKLGWTGRKSRWRLVVIDEDECEDLMSMPRECRVEACFLLEKLVKRMDLL